MTSDSTRPSIARRGRALAPLGLLGAVGLIVLVEWAVASRAAAFTTVWAAQWRWSGREATRAASTADVLCFGDSLVMHGVVPQALELRLGRASYNLAMSNAQMPACYFLLRRALDAGARPSALIVDGEILDYQPLSFTRLWPELLTVREACELAWTARNADFLAGFLAARGFPSVKDRHEIRESILAALRGQPLDRAAVYRTHRRNHDANRGAQVLAAAAVTEVDPWLEVIATVPSSSWSCDPVNARYVERFLSLAASRKVPVFWLLPPTHPAFQERREREGRDALHMSFVRKLLVRFPGVTVVDGRHAGYAREVMADQSHLNQRGAWEFSVAVAEVVGARLDSRRPSAENRWVATAPFAGRPPAPTVEDLAQSRIVLENSERRRR